MICSIHVLDYLGFIGFSRNFVGPGSFANVYNCVRNLAVGRLDAVLCLLVAFRFLLPSQGCLVVFSIVLAVVF